MKIIAVHLTTWFACPSLLFEALMSIRSLKNLRVNKTGGAVFPAAFIKNNSVTSLVLHTSLGLFVSDLFVQQLLVVCALLSL